MNSEQRQDNIKDRIYAAMEKSAHCYSRCLYCKWWIIHPSDLDDPERDKDENQCHRYPPRNYETQDGEVQAYFPDTQEWEGCGEFILRQGIMGIMNEDSSTFL